MISLCLPLLWFAFKIFDLWCREQLSVAPASSSMCCDLLSKFSIFDVVNNRLLCYGANVRVVICFQNFRSLMSWTTTSFYNNTRQALWFAFKIFDLWCREQQKKRNIIMAHGCDLLSKFSIFDVVNNRMCIMHTLIGCCKAS